MINTSFTSNFSCKKCNFLCSKKGDYNRHITTVKHINLTNPNSKHSNKTKTYTCICGKIYKHLSTLCNHKNRCSFIPIEPDKNEGIIPNNKDVMIEKLVEELTSERAEMKEIVDKLIAERAEKSEMKSMFMLIIEKYQDSLQRNEQDKHELIKIQTEDRLQNNKDNKEILNKIVEIIPKLGNTTNNNNNTTNNTLNFYLTNTCKNAESIHDFTDRYVKRCSDFFIENYRDIANNQMCLASNVYDIMFKCLNDTPQCMNFIQTTDVKNGIHYVKEKKKDENRQLCGEAEFIKYVDGFERAGASIGHAINKAIVPLQTEYMRQLEQEVGRSPDEDDFEDEDEYEDALDKYKIRKKESSRNLQINVCKTMSLFDVKARQMDILKKTKRSKEDDIV